MGIPGLISAIGTGERVSLSKLAISHLERTAKPIRVAVDISIWLFQVQAGRGGKNPELRTLFFRLLKLLALPIHPLFVYDGRHKPPFKRGKAVSARSYGNSPLIRRSKDLIERFRFPWHEAPGEAEAECARLQTAGIVDAVMSDDVDALMFGSTLTIMNFSKENGSGTSAATHVTCYSMGNEGHVSNIPLNRAGMILFAMLSGGDYLPSGIPKCGSKLAAEIAKAGFGEDLLQELASRSSDLDLGLSEWRERLQYELEENESGYFSTKHKAVRVPEDFPDQKILQYYAEPKVSTEDEMATLKRHLRHAWDREIDPVAIRSFAADHFEWNYRSGARKVIKLLAEPLISYRLRLQRPVSNHSQGTLAPNCDTPWLQRVYRSRASFATDGSPELQMDMLPIDVVGLDLLAEEPNPLPPTQETVPSQSPGDEDDPEINTEAAPPTPSKSRVTKRFDPFAIEKVWIFETIARLGVPDIVRKWDAEQAAKANKATAPNKSNNKRSGPKKKGPIDPGMPRGSIEKYGMMKKGSSGLSSASKTHILEAATSTTSFKTPPSLPESIDLDDPFAPSMYSHQQSSGHARLVSGEVDELIGTFATLSTMSPAPSIKRHPMARQSRVPARSGILASREAEFDGSSSLPLETISSLQNVPRRGLTLSYSVSDNEAPAIPTELITEDIAIPSSVSKNRHRQNHRKAEKAFPLAERSHELDELELAIGSLSLDRIDSGHDENSAADPLRQPKSFKKKEVGTCPTINYQDDGSSSNKSISSDSCSSRAVKQSVSAKLKSGGDIPTSRRDPFPCNASHDKKPSPKNKKKKQCQQTRETIGHAENVTAANGFWEVDAPSESNGGHLVVERPGQECANHQKPKRVPRVSILDMI